MKNRIKFNLQLFADDFATGLASKLGVSVEPEKVAEPPVADNIPDGEESGQSTEVKHDDEKPEVDTSEGEVDKPKRDLEKDSAFAKLRREKEALEKAQKERDKFYADNFAEYGIATEAEYRTKMLEQKQADLIEKVQAGDETAIEDLAELKAQEKAQKAFEAEKLKLELQTEVLDLKKEFNLNIDSYEDLSKIERGEEVVALMAAKKPNGEYYTATEAYRMINHDKIIADAVKQAKQQAKNEAAGFSHTKTETKTGGEVESVVLDAETLRMFERMGMKPNTNFLKQHIK